MSWKIEADALRAAKPRHVLFLCVANSARSQMAEGIARSLAPEGVRISSAGSVPSYVHPLAIRALAEIGIDISTHESKGVDSIRATDIDAVITLCSDEVCPAYLGRALRIHWAMPDPTVEGLDGFRRVRDELRTRLTYVFEETGS